jgi:UDP-N-acetylglucosamine 2-epimerase (non-hydrolysing)
VTRISVIFGTRPEVIKLAPVIKELEQDEAIHLDVCFTGQHREMVLPLIEFFEIPVHYSLDLMQPNQSLAGLSGRSMIAVDEYLQKTTPQIVFVQGDTTTAMCASVVSFYRGIKVAHVEAGLRTYNLSSPFPEEFNRQIISKIADLHFCPTETARQNLVTEKTDVNKTLVTGNTVIDALLFAQKKLSLNGGLFNQPQPWDDKEKKIILITGHRRENFGLGFENICSAIKLLAEKYRDFNFVYPVHLNPNVVEPVKRILNGLPNVFLISPLDYVRFTALMNSCHFILTDSGGVQEEAPSLKKPVLILRDTTERNEAVQAGAAKLVGVDQDSIIKNAVELIENKDLYERMSNVTNPFGSGDAAKIIVKHIKSTLN